MPFPSYHLEVNQVISDWYNSFLLNSTEHQETRLQVFIHPSSVSWEPPMCWAPACHCRDTVLNSADTAPPSKDGSSHSAGLLPRHTPPPGSPVYSHPPPAPGQNPRGTPPIFWQKENESQFSGTQQNLNCQLELSTYPSLPSIILCEVFPDKGEVVFQPNSPALAHWLR